MINNLATHHQMDRNAYRSTSLTQRVADCTLVKFVDSADDETIIVLDNVESIGDYRMMP